MSKRRRAFPTASLKGLTQRHPAPSLCTSPPSSPTEIAHLLHLVLSVDGASSPFPLLPTALPPMANGNSGDGLLTDGHAVHPTPLASARSPEDLRKSPPPSPPPQQDIQRLAQIGDFLLLLSRTRGRRFQDEGQPTPQSSKQNNKTKKESTGAGYFLLASHIHLSRGNVCLSCANWRTTGREFRCGFHPNQPQS